MAANWEMVRQGGVEHGSSGEGVMWYTPPSTAAVLSEEKNSIINMVVV